MEKQIDYITKPLWRWLVAIPIALVTAYDLYRQEFNPTAPRLWGILNSWPWWVWLLLSLLVVAFIVIEGLWRNNKENPDVKKPSVRSEAKNGGISIAAGGDIVNPTIYPPGDYSKDKKRQEKLANWDDVHFHRWNKDPETDGAGRGIAIENRKNEIIQKFDLEIIGIYNEQGVPIRKWDRGELPSIAGWDDNGTIRYDETDIRIGKTKQFILIDNLQLFFDGCPGTWFISGSKHFQYNLSHNETCFVEVQAAGMVGTVSLKPKTKFVTVFFDGKSVHIKDVSDELPLI